MQKPENFRRTRRVMRKSDVAHTKSILSAANNPALNWTIGSKLSANSKARRFGASKQARRL